MHNFKKVGNWLFFIGYLLASLAAVRVSSIGGSFAKWNDFMGIPYFINLHASLLAVCGWGLFVLLLLVAFLFSRILNLETQLRALSAAKGGDVKTSLSN